jgi:hypothetical protein
MIVLSASLLVLDEQTPFLIHRCSFCVLGRTDSVLGSSFRLSSFGRRRRQRCVRRHGLRRTEIGER